MIKNMMKYVFMCILFSFVNGCKPVEQGTPDAGQSPGTFNGRVARYRLTVRSANFVEIFDPSAGYYTYLVLSDDEAFCSRFRNNGAIEGGSTYLYFYIARERNGALLPLDVGSYSLDSSALTGRIAQGYFAPTTLQCDSQIANDADATTIFGDLTLTNVSSSRLVGSFNATFGAFDVVDGTFNAEQCSFDLSTASCI